MRSIWPETNMRLTAVGSASFITMRAPPLSPKYKCAQQPEPIIGQMQKLLRDRQINQRRMDVLVAEIRGQVWQHGLGVDACPIPFGHSVNHECVAKVVDAWACATARTRWFYASAPQDASQQTLHRNPRVSALSLLMPEQSRVFVGRATGFLPRVHVGLKGRKRAR